MYSRLEEVRSLCTVNKKLPVYVQSIISNQSMYSQTEDVNSLSTVNSK